MDKNGENTQVNTPSGNIPQQPVKFDRSFTPEVDKYIELCKQNKKRPTVKGFANHIGTDVFSVNAWAYKKKKDETGKVINEWARPNFLAAIQKLEKLEKEEKEDDLNARQELFCELYATDREFFGNGTQAYIEAYEPNTSKPNWYKSAQASASRLLSNVMVLKRINELLEAEGLNDAHMDKQLYLVATQNVDFSSKVAAIREYNKLKKRVTEKLDLTTGGKAIKQVVELKYITPEVPNGEDNTDNQTDL